MTYRLYGALGSPYSLKMRAVLRYRRLPHLWIHGRQTHQDALEQVRAKVIPVLEYPDGRFLNDSTPLILDLERQHAERSIVPEREADAFLAFLIEDFADEWLTKAMFHYRWFRPRDAAQMSQWLAFDAFKGGGVEGINAFASAFRDRQVGRMALVGCTAQNQPVIEGTTNRVLSALDAHAANQHCFFGTRPSLAEFSVYGQLSQLGVDPTPHDLMREKYPFAYRWLYHIDDMSGIEGEWFSDSTPRLPIVHELLAVIGEVYLPFLIANDAAVAKGADTLTVRLMGQDYSQAPFRYQAKCLLELRRAYGALSQEAKSNLETLLQETGCLPALKGG